jgi:hypothetical protein
MIGNPEENLPRPLLLGRRHVRSFLIAVTMLVAFVACGCCGRPRGISQPDFISEAQSRVASATGTRDGVGAAESHRPNQNAGVNVMASDDSLSPIA